MSNHLVIYQGEIPQNTGNMMRTCMASGSKLHLIKPLGFELDDKHLQRAGMDYMKQLDFKIYENWEEFIAKNPEATTNSYFLTRYGEVPPSNFDFSDPHKEYYFVVGKESTGIDKDILRDHLDRCMRLPMVKDARSLNVSNCAAIIIYEALRQQDYYALSREEVIKGKDFLK